jgi:hypothetical protein
MTGKIEVLATATTPGRITTNSGSNRFHYSYSLPPGRALLHVGGLVTFELEKGTAGNAVAVCPIEKSLLDGKSGPPEVRYHGFEQKNDVRCFKFRTWRMGEENQEVVVMADLALFRRHGITIQEGPALCLRFVEAELQQRSFNESGGWSRALTQEEVVAYMAHRRGPGKKR